MSCLLVLLTLVFPSIRADYGWRDGTEIDCRHSNGTYTTPGTECREYYSCQHGVAKFFTCPQGTMFNPFLQRCQVSGDCYELVCYGRIDGTYMDATQACLRKYECHGGKVLKVSATTKKLTCPPLSYSAARVLSVKNRCSSSRNGRYIDDDHCRGYYVCDGGHELARFSCPEGHSFNGTQCAKEGRCHNICSGKADGVHPDVRLHCSQYVLCKKGTVKFRHTCPAETVFNYDSCVPESTYSCNNPCQGRPDGLYPNSCHSYFQCEGGKLLVEKSCSPNHTFDGKQCISSHKLKCSGPKRTLFCLGKVGWYSNSTYCRKFYHCAEDSTIIDYKCPAGHIFNGISSSPGASCAEPVLDSCKDKLV